MSVSIRLQLTFFSFTRKPDFGTHLQAKPITFVPVRPFLRNWWLKRAFVFLNKKPTEALAQAGGGGLNVDVLGHYEAIFQGLQQIYSEQENKTPNRIIHRKKERKKGRTLN